MAAGLKLDARRKKILDILEQDGKVRVSELSEWLNTSVVTIRNDLDSLENSGYLERVPGGAVQSDRNRSNLQFIRHRDQLREEKKAIARACACVIRDGATIMMNSGTTTFYVAQELKRFSELNIVTNSLAIAQELGALSSFRVILLGGNINVQYAFTHGGDVHDQLRRYRADYSILAAEGADMNVGVTTFHAEEAVVDRLMLERANTHILAVDHTKLGREGFSFVTELSDIHMIATDNQADPAVLERFKASGIRILQSE